MSHIKNGINQINSKVVLSLDSCLIHAVLTVPLSKVRLITRIFWLNYLVIFCSVLLCFARAVTGAYQNNTWNLCCNTCCNWVDVYFIDTSFVTSVLPKHAYNMGGTKSCFYDIPTISKLQKTGFVTWFPKRKWK